MKSVVREGVFETNSSSAHTLAFRTLQKPKLKPPEKFQHYIKDDGYIHVKLGTYGRECDILETLTEKLSYIASGIIFWSENNIENKEWWNDEKVNEDTVPPKEWRAWLTDQEKIESDPEWQLVVDEVKAYLPDCKGIKLLPSHGFIDHQSSGFYEKIINGKQHTLKEILFSDDVYILVDHDEH